jgi:group II intron reverse transcriptase/maturase
MARILNEVYEPRFLGCSYGFREGRSAHDALREVNQILMTKRVNYVLDCDIEGFFDNVDHGWMMRFLANDISDRSFLRYVSRFLKAGVMEEGKRAESDRGTPQGGLISPVLANVYLHYALDLWAVKYAFPKLKGEAHLVRYADDFVVMFQHEREARAFYEALKLRMARFGLKLAEDKTRILPFGRWKGAKETFDFLGFTHFNARTRTGKYTVGHRVAKKKMKQKKENIKKWIKENRTMPLASMLRALNVKLVGTFRYYGISGMFGQVLRIYKYAKCTAYKWLNRRSQRRSFSYSAFLRTWEHYVAGPKVYTDIWGWKGETKSLA